MLIATSCFENFLHWQDLSFWFRTLAFRCCFNKWRRLEISQAALVMLFDNSNVTKWYLELDLGRLRVELAGKCPLRSNLRVEADPNIREFSTSAWFHLRSRSVCPFSNRSGPAFWIRVSNAKPSKERGKYRWHYWERWRANQARKNEILPLA